jgi:hypothetical protein
MEDLSIDTIHRAVEDTVRSWIHSPQQALAVARALENVHARLKAQALTEVFRRCRTVLESLPHDSPSSALAELRRRVRLPKDGQQPARSIASIVLSVLEQCVPVAAAG